MKAANRSHTKPRKCEYSQYRTRLKFGGGQAYDRSND